MAHQPVHLLETQPFDPSVTESVSTTPAPFGAWGFAGDVEEDVVTGGGAEIYAADGWYNSLPADSPANQHYAPILLAPFNFETTLFDGLEPTGRATRGYGDIILWNGDGALDAILDQGWSGRPLTLKRGQPWTALSGFETVFVGTVDGLVPDEEKVTLRLRDRRALLERPLSASLYQGSGGAEGGSDLAGKRKPVAWGRLFNVPAVLIDAANLVYQLHDGRIRQVDAVRDKGVALAFDADHASYAALIGGTLAAGEYATCLAAGLIRLGGAPEGGVRVDLRGEQEAGSPDGYVERADAIVRRIVTTRLDTANLSDPADLDVDSFATLAAAQPAPLGFWQGPDSTLTVAGALDMILSSIGGIWDFTLPGKLWVGRLEAPAGDADVVLTRADIVLGSAPLALPGGVPSYRRLVGWQRNWGAQSADELAGAVTAADRLLYGTEYRYATASDAAVLTKHGNAREVVTQGLFALEADASAEAARLQTLHGTERRELVLELRRDDPFAVRPDWVVELRDINRLGLSSSAKFRLKGFGADLALGTTTWVLWGGGT